MLIKNAEVYMESSEEVLIDDEDVINIEDLYLEEDTYLENEDDLCIFNIQGICRCSKSNNQAKAHEKCEHFIKNSSIRGNLWI